LRNNIDLMCDITVLPQLAAEARQRQGPNFSASTSRAVGTSLGGPAYPARS